MTEPRNENKTGLQPLWTVHETADLLHISERTLWALTNQGAIPCVRIGRAVRYDPRDIEAWLARQKRAST